MVGRDRELTGVVEQVVQQELRRKQWQEREQGRSRAGTEDVAEVARRPHEHVLDGVGEDSAALGDTVGDDVQALLQQYNVGRGAGDVGGGVDREPDVGMMQSESVVDPITEKAHRLTVCGQDANDAGLLFRRHAGKDGRSCEAVAKLVVVELVDLGSREWTARR